MNSTIGQDLFWSRPEEERDVLKLYYSEHLSVYDIAEKLHMNLDEVNDQLTQARIRLSQRYNKRKR